MAFWGIYSYLYSLSLRTSFPYRLLLEDLIRTLKLRQGAVILEAGCGPGLVVERIVQGTEGKGISVTGLDLSERMIGQARIRCRDFANVTLQVADLDERLLFPDSFFDRVVCCNTLYALHDPRRALSEFHRVLRQGGAAIIANPKPNAGEDALIRAHIGALWRLTPLYRRIYHILGFLLLLPVNLAIVAINRVIIGKGRSGEYHFLSREDLQQLLEEVGFRNIDVRSCYADQDWLVRAEK